MAGLSIHIHRQIADIETCVETASRSKHSDFHDTIPWYRNFAAACLDPGDRLALYELESETGYRAGLPMRERLSRWGPFRVRTLASLTNYYSCRFNPYGLEALRDPVAAIVKWAAEVRKTPAPPHRIEFDALAAESPVFESIKCGLRNAGYWVEGYPQFGNWYLQIEDRDFGRYWKRRDSSLRHTVERKERALRRSHKVTIEVFDSPRESEAAVAAYQRVYARSWKLAEPYSLFIPGLIRTGLAEGALAVGILNADHCPVAAQIWIIFDGNATIFKLAHDREFEKWSMGSILTRIMIERAFANPGIRDIDFGRGDDPYKQLWLPQRRERWGIVAFEPKTIIGVCLALRNFAPAGLRRLVRIPGRR